MTDQERFLRVAESRSRADRDSTFALRCLLTVALAEQAGLSDADLFKLREQLELGRGDEPGIESEFSARARTLIEGKKTPNAREQLLLDLIQPVEGKGPRDGG